MIPHTVTVALLPALLLSSPAVVEVSLQARGEPAACVQLAIAGALKGAGFQIRWRRAGESPGPHALVYVRLDLTAHDRARLSFAPAGSNGSSPPATRDVRLDHRSAEAGCEELAQVVTAAVISLADTSAGASAPPTEASAPPMRASPVALVSSNAQPAAVASPAIEAAYELKVMAWPVIAQEIQAAYMRAVPQGFRWRQVFRVGYAFPATPRSDLVAVRLQTLSLHYAGLVVFGEPSRWVEWEGGFGFELSYIQPSAAAGSTVVPSSASWSSVGVVEHRVGMAWRTRNAFVIALSVLLDAYLPQRLIVPSGTVQPPAVVFEGWMLRPGIHLGIRW